MFILDIETTLFVEFKQNPFIFDSVPLVDTMFYVNRIYNLLNDKYENMDANDWIGEIVRKIL